MHDIFILDQQSADFVNGRTKRPPGTSFWILLLLLGIPAGLAIAATVSSLMAVRSWSNWIDLRSHGVTTQGTIVAAGIVRAQTTATEQQRYYEYEFTVDGTTYRGRHITKRGAILAIDDGYTKEGDFVDIVYLPDNPGHSKIAGTATWPAFTTSFAAVLLLVAALFAFALLKFSGGLSGLRAMLPRRAECIHGELVSITPAPDSGSSSAQTALVYGFTSPQSGERIEREQVTSFPLPEPLPEPGCTIAVAYIDDAQHWLL